MFKLFNCRGAMFGLDARLALGVFAVIGTIAGVVTYTAVIQAREASQLNTVKAVTAAFENYVKDAKVAPVSFNDFFIDSGAQNWSGPYLSGSFRQAGDNSWQSGIALYSLSQGASDDAAVPVACPDADNCYTTIAITSTRGSDMTALDQMYDGGESAESGNVRTSNDGDDWTAYVFMKSIRAVPIEVDDGGEECQQLEFCSFDQFWDEETCSCQPLDGGGGKE